MIVPKPHQSANAATLFEALKNFGAGLDASDTGTGKTITSLLLCKELAARPAIITRKYVIPSWQAACASLGVEPLFITNYEGARTKGFALGKGETKERVGRGGMKKTRTYAWDQNLGRVVFIFDESQACRSPKSFNSKMLLSAAGRYKTLLLSATPFTNPLEMFPQGATLRLFNQNDYYRWLFNHGCKKDYFGHFEWVGDKKDGKKQPPGTNLALGKAIMEALNAEVFPSRGCRTRRFEIPGFPETLVLPTAAEMDEADDIQKLYLAELEENRRGDLERRRAELPDELKEIAEVLPVTLDLRRRQEVELLKVNSIVEMAEDARDKGDRVAIFVNFDATIEVLKKKLKTDAVLRGKRESSDLTNAPHLFQNNQVDFMILNSAAGGPGINLHDPVTQVPRTSIISPPWSAMVFKQVLGRVNRLGGGFSTQRVVFASGTIEDRVMHRMNSRIQSMDTLLDGLTDEDLTLDSIQ